MFTQDKVERAVKDELVGHANISYTIVTIQFIGTLIVSMSATSNVDNIIIIYNQKQRANKYGSLRVTVTQLPHSCQP